MIEIDAVVGEKTYVSYEDITKCEYALQVGLASYQPNVDKLFIFFIYF